MTSSIFNVVDSESISESGTVKGHITYLVRAGHPIPHPFGDGRPCGRVRCRARRGGHLSGSTRAHSAGSVFSSGARRLPILVRGSYLLAAERLLADCGIPLENDLSGSQSICETV